MCRRWFHPEFWDESPAGWLEQRPRWLCRAGSAAQGLLCCSPFPGNFRERPFPPLRSVPSVLLRWHLRALPRAGSAARGVLAVCAARGWPLLSPCHTKGRGTGAQGRGGCSAMASPAVAAGRGDGSCCSGDIPPVPYSGGVRKSRHGDGGMEWPILTCVPAQCCHSSLTRVWVALKAASTCHRNQSGHSPALLSVLICACNYFGELGRAPGQAGLQSGSDGSETRPISHLLGVTSTLPK